MKIKELSYINLILLTGLLILVIALMQTCQGKRDTENALKAMNGEMIKIKGINGGLGGLIQNMSDSRANLKELLSEEKELNKALRKGVNVGARIETVYKDTGVLKVDTIIFDLSGSPTYSSIDSNKFMKIAIRASKEQIEYNYTSYANIYYTLDRKMFKNDIVKVYTDNPNVSISDIKGFEVKPKRISLGFFAGYGLTPKGIQPVIGGGINIKVK